jgi:glutaminyl-tRNA synthetase
MAVLDPVKLVITNYPDGQTETVDCENNPEQPATGTRPLPFSKELWIEREDFMEEASKKWFRLAPGAIVRLKSAYIVRCTGCNKDADGNIAEVLCEYISESKSGGDSSGLHAKGTIHWISVPHAATAEIRLYDRLFNVENPAAEEGDFQSYINPESLQIISKAFIEPSLLEATAGEAVQFIRKGYFTLDSMHTTADKMVFNRTVGLKDSWKK